MTPSETIEFLKNIGCTQIYVVLLVKDVDKADEELQKIKDLGYLALLRTTAFGTEIVVTEKYGIGPTRLEIS